jgi:hypothetical protein
VSNGKPARQVETALPTSDTRALARRGTRPSGSRRVAPYIELRALLLQYLSSILVDTVLNQAMFRRGLSPHDLGPKELHELAPDMMLGLRLFVAEKRLPELMVALAEILDVSEP